MCVYVCEFFMPLFWHNETTTITIIKTIIVSCFLKYSCKNKQQQNMYIENFYLLIYKQKLLPFEFECVSVTESERERVKCSKA